MIQAISYLITVRHLFQETKIKKEKDSSYRTYDSMLVRNNNPITIDIYSENKWQKNFWHPSLLQNR
jgi:hypothetical protein